MRPKTTRRNRTSIYPGFCQVRLYVFCTSQHSNHSSSEYRAVSKTIFLRPVFTTGLLWSLHPGASRTCTGTPNGASSRNTARLEATTSQQQLLQGDLVRRQTTTLEDSLPDLRKRRKTAHGGADRNVNGDPSNSGGGGAAAASAEAAATSQAGPNMSGPLFLDSSLSLFHSMDVDGGDASGSNGDGAVEDWTQHESIFNSPPPPLPSAMPPPPSNAGPSRAVSALANTSGASNASNPTTTPPAGLVGVSANQLLGQTPSPNAQGHIVSPRPLSTVRQPSAQRNSMSHSIVGASSAAGATTANPSTRSKEREQLMSGPLMFR